MSPAPAGPARAAARLRAALGLATLAMLALSWPLWVEAGAFPRVPFVAGLPQLPPAATWVHFALIVGTIAAAVAGQAPRVMLLASIALLVPAVLGDQDRLQPWVYQYLLTAAALALAPPGRALGFARLFVVVQYFHSGLSKLDATFVQELGAVFLDAGLRPFGASSGDWPPAWRTAAVLAMPAAELLVAVGLCVRATRPIALAGAIALHLALIGILGPWGLGHSTIVLVWNAALVVEVLILFTPPAFDPAARGRLPYREWPLAAAFAVAAALPFGERRGFWDTWPSFALYASHAERTEIDLHEEDLLRYPPEVAAHAVRVAPGRWLRLDLTGWSRAATGVPVYPQNRVALGLAEAVARRAPGAIGPRVTLRGRADRWTGRRSSERLFGREAIRRRADRERINAHPEGLWMEAGAGTAR